MKRIGVMKVSGHSYWFGGYLNEFDRDKMIKYAGQFRADRFLETFGGRIPFEETRITKVWDYDVKNAKAYAETFGVDVVENREEMLEDVDAVMIPDTSGDGSDHCELASPLLEIGIPLFVDKPFAHDVSDACKMVDIAKRTGAPLMSASVLRYVKPVEELKEREEELGEIRSVIATGTGGLLVYGIHACELFHSLLGHGVESVHNVGSEDRDLIRVGYSDGRTVILQVFRVPVASSSMHLMVYGSKKMEMVSAPPETYHYGAMVMMRKFLEMIRTRRLPIPYDEILEVLRILLGARKSLEEKREVFLKELEQG